MDKIDYTFFNIYNLIFRRLWTVQIAYWKKKSNFAEDEWNSVFEIINWSLTHADKTLVSVQQQENHSHKRNNSKYLKADMGKDHAIWTKWENES